MTTQAQQNLFDRAPAPWEQDDASDQLIASVIFARGPGKPFDYVVPDSLREEVEPGRRVRAPLGRGDRLSTGYCVRLATRPVGQRTLKPLQSVVDRHALLSPAILRLTEWMAEHYLCPWGHVLEAVLPAGVRAEAGTREVVFLSIAGGVVERLAELKLRGKQARIMQYLAACSQPISAARLAEAIGCTSAPISALRKKRLIVSAARRVDADDPDGTSSRPGAQAGGVPLELNADQRIALAAIMATLESASHSAVLIHGVTGSGKTEVYMQAIAEVLRYGRQAIVLVPEISLTPQAQERFRSRFGAVAVLHSHLTDVERRRYWRQIARAEVQVVVGARSAIFAPTPRLGIIILDEEHETSFKQAESPRYHARDVALERARAEGIPLVLGSATPSLESWHRAQQGEYHLISLPRRVFDRPLPAVGTIDLKAEFQDRRSRGAISRALHQAMDLALKDDGQVILLLNRRGFSTHIQCSACGLVVRCPHCVIALTHHLHEQIAVCHYCDYRQRAPTQCPECNFPDIHYSGFGTQKLEAEVRSRFPNHRCLRMDTDTMQKHGSHERALAAFHSGEVRILLGTQMIAKGLDFPNVTLVGVINADTALHLPDFRAAERTFQLVTQVAGRTGRGERGGRVLVQTFSPEHPAIAAATQHDYAQFAAAELPHRNEMGYPPFTSMVRLVARGPVEAPTSQFAAQLAERLRAAIDQLQITARVLGPAAAPISRLRGKYRFQLQVQSADGDLLLQAVRQATADIKPPSDVEWIADVDPLDML